MKDVAETLVPEADAIGTDLAFDVNGKRIRVPKTTKPKRSKKAS